MFASEIGQIRERTLTGTVTRCRLRFETAMLTVYRTENATIVRPSRVVSLACTKKPRLRAICVPIVPLNIWIAVRVHGKGKPCNTSLLYSVSPARRCPRSAAGHPAAARVQQLTQIESEIQNEPGGRLPYATYGKQDQSVALSTAPKGISALTVSMFLANRPMSDDELSYPPDALLENPAPLDPPVSPLLGFGFGETDLPMSTAEDPAGALGYNGFFSGITR